MTTPAPLPRRRLDAAGFTLIEVLISILIFSLGVLGTVAMQARAVQFAEQNGDRSRAAIFANELVSNMWAVQSATPDPTFLTNWNNRLTDPTVSGLPNASYKLTTSTATNTSTIQIFWSGPSAVATAPAQYTTTVVIQ